jgi:hypothetical protein
VMTIEGCEPLLAWLRCHRTGQMVPEKPLIQLRAFWLGCSGSTEVAGPAAGLRTAVWRRLAWQRCTHLSERAGHARDLCRRRPFTRMYTQPPLGAATHSWHHTLAHCWTAQGQRRATGRTLDSRSCWVARGRARVMLPNV